jgi:glycosyltransferase involved in cell wall biosynthesis
MLTRGTAAYHAAPLPCKSPQSMSVPIIHVLPHRGGGGEAYIDMLERLPGFTHERFYLSAGRTPSSGLASIPLRWPRLAIRVRASALIHTHGDVTSALVLPLLRTRPAVMTTHGLSMLRRITGSRRTAFIHALAQVARTSDAVICTSATERDELGGVLPDRYQDKLLVIPNGIDPPLEIDEPRRRAIRAELEADSETVLGVFAGELEPNKSPLLAARAAIRVRASGVPFVLAIAGDGPQTPQLRSLAGPAVRVLGYRSDLQQLMAASDVFVQPSEREGTSFALLEAMGHGLAIVAAAGRGSPETVGDAALLFESGDEDSLVAALEALASDPELRGSLGRRARARMLERFEVGTFLERTEAVYRRSLEVVRR